MFGVRFWLGKIWHCSSQRRKSVARHRIPSDADVRHSRHPWQLNESRFVLTASNACLFLVVAARDVLNDNLKADWPQERVMANLGSTTISLITEICTETICSSCQNRPSGQHLGIK